MADTFLIDGYNLIYALGMIDRHLGTKALEHSRRCLLEFLKEALDSGTIVFDAKHAPRHVRMNNRFKGCASSSPRRNKALMI